MQTNKQQQHPPTCDVGDAPATDIAGQVDTPLVDTSRQTHGPDGGAGLERLLQSQQCDISPVDVVVVWVQDNLCHARLLTGRDV